MNKLILTFSIGFLVVFYLYQKPIMVYLSPNDLQGFTLFVFKKTVRFLINDVLMLGVIYGLFNNLDYLKVALMVQAFGLLFLLIPYLILKYNMGSYNGPLISFLHRLVLNPLLLIMLIPALYFHKKNIKT